MISVVPRARVLFPASYLPLPGSVSLATRDSRPRRRLLARESDVEPATPSPAHARDQKESESPARLPVTEQNRVEERASERRAAPRDGLLRAPCTRLSSRCCRRRRRRRRRLQSLPRPFHSLTSSRLYSFSLPLLPLAADSHAAPFLTLIPLSSDSPTDTFAVVAAAVTHLF